MKREGEGGRAERQRQGDDGRKAGQGREREEEREMDGQTDVSEGIPKPPISEFRKVEAAQRSGRETIDSPRHGNFMLCSGTGH